MEKFPTYKGVEVFRLAPEGWGEVDFDNRTVNPNILPQYIIMGIGIPLAFIALMQRYYTKMFLAKGLQLDDYLMLGGWICSILTQAIQTASIAEQGFCYNSWEMPLWEFERYALKSYIAAPIYQMCNGLVKLSLLTFYLHISPQRWFRVSVWVNIVIVLLYTIVIAALFYFNCIPPRKQFDFKVEGKCFDAGPLYMATAVSNIVTDLVLLILPIPMVIQLHMPKWQKFGAVVVFGVGSITIGTSVLRLVVLPPLLNSTNPSWDGCQANVWTFAEANLFIICGSMPTLRKFFKHFAPKLMNSSRNGSTPGTTSHTYGPGRSHHQGSTTLRSARKSQHPYLHFPEEEEGSDDHEMRDFSSSPGEPTTTVGVASGDPQRDDHSEKAILQTKSFTVQYDDR